jgi:HlyD family secretion protein
VNRNFWIAAALAAAPACRDAETAPLYEKAAVERRNIQVAVSASGAIEPILTVDVKSKASGEIIEMRIQTGDDVRQGDLLASIDPRVPRNNQAQADANLVVAQAQLTNAQAALARADTLYKVQAITETELENARLAYANANAQVVRARTDLENARDRMTDTRVRAPLNGTIIAKNVELGTVISSPTQDVGGGTIMFKMANLDTVQVRTLVDETDIGKVQAGLPASITVDAYPNRPFQGSVLKIEPQATVMQNVTMFPVLVRIANPNHLLKPGMNAEVEVHVANRQNVLAIPYASLRTQRDVSSAASVLGLDPAAVQQQLAQQASPPGGPGGADTGRAAMGSGAPRGAGGDTTQRAGAGQGETINMMGREIRLPPGVTRQQVEAIRAKREAGQDLTAADRAIMQRIFSQFQSGGGGGFRMGAGGPGGPGGRSPMEPTSYIVFTWRDGKPTPVQIRTGMTDLDFVEVQSGLTEQDTVLLLPSASLLNAQREMRERTQRMTGGGAVPGMQQTPPAGAQKVAPR